jgi:hypothetical protein
MTVHGLSVPGNFLTKKYPEKDLSGRMAVRAGKLA